MKNHDDIIGAYAPAAWTWILESNPEISSINAFKFSAPPPLSRRTMLSPTGQQLLESTKELANKYGVPFWEALLLTGSRAEHFPAEFLDAVAYSSQDPSTIITIFRSQMYDNILSVLSNDSMNMNLAVMSKVNLANESIGHIPLLDFRCRTSPSNDQLVIDISRRLLPKGGLVLDSGMSYHLISRTIVSLDDLLDFMAASLLYSPIVDSYYISHHLRLRWCSLRISKGGRKSTIPKVIAVF